MTAEDRARLLHRAVTDMTVAVQYLEMAAEDLKLVDGADAQGNLRLVVFAERARDQAVAGRRLIDDVKREVKGK